MASVRLHTCPCMFVKLDGHPCWRVKKALDDQGIEHEIVKEPVMKGRRDRLERLSGQRLLPVIEFEDGSAYRADSREMEARIRAGRLFGEGAGPAAPGSTPAQPAG